MGWKNGIPIVDRLIPNASKYGDQNMWSLAASRGGPTAAKNCLIKFKVLFVTINSAEGMEFSSAVRSVGLV
ncbi:hypothetical protein AVEN_247637-1 [Araneus ventricosus]|uniref:Uncharacterized protein n=1 Tax=Araneus ventricosus TaxID=182803 RepID=A0A4Y2V7D0_ARAVE|nr:hypothetical protein AVEN_247637-1 [Araneus ventricosus]